MAVAVGGMMADMTPNNGETAPDFEEMLATMRPGLHRYCARMTGSTVDGEDIVQDALMKAIAARPAAGPLANPRAWMLRIAHNTALDFLRRRARSPAEDGAYDAELVAAPALPDPDIAGACLRTFLRLPVLQRGAVILKDVLDHSLEEAAVILGVSEPAAKSALQRGRKRLRALGRVPETDAAATLDPALRARLIAYVQGFRERDFDAIRAMLADEVRLDLVARLKRNGKDQVGEYLGRYAACTQWAFAAGMVEGRCAMLVFDRGVSLDTPDYVVLLEFEDGCVAVIRDFLFARYAMEGIDAIVLS